MGDPAFSEGWASCHNYHNSTLRGQHIEEQLNEHEVQYHAKLFLPLNDSILLIGFGMLLQNGEQRRGVAKSLVS